MEYIRDFRLTFIHFDIFSILFIVCNLSFLKYFRRIFHFFIDFSVNQDHLVLFGALDQFCLTRFLNFTLHYAEVQIVGGKYLF